MKGEELIWAVVVAVGCLTIVAIVLTLPTYFLWNWLMPKIFGLTRITLCQALGLNILGSILLGRISYNSK